MSKPSYIIVRVSSRNAITFLEYVNIESNAMRRVANFCVRWQSWSRSVTSALLMEHAVASLAVSLLATKRSPYTYHIVESSEARKRYAFTRCRV